MSEQALAAPRLRTLRALPTPPGLPWFGQALSVDRARMHLQLEDWSRRYEGMYRIRLGGRDFLVVGDAAATANALRERPQKLGRTERFRDVASRMGALGLFASNGDAWKRQRPMVMAAFDPGHIKSYFPRLEQVTARFAARWQRAAAGGRAIDLQADLMRYTVDVISGLAFGADINTIDSDGDVIQQHLDKLLPAIFRRVFAPLQLWRVFKGPDERAVDRAVAEVARAVQRFIAEARARLAADAALRANPANLIEAMLIARDAPGSGVTDDDVAGNVVTMLLAGEDTTANTLAWMIWLLHMNPEAMAQARREVREVLGDAPWPTRLEQVAALDVVEACAHETMRLKPVAPVLPLQTHEPMVIGDVQVDAGTLVMFLMRTGSVDARHFPDPARFDPGRWLAGGSEATSAKRVSMPFGAGGRICPGRYLALVEMKMVMAMLLAGFDIESVSAPGGLAPEERLAFTMSPVGLQLKLRGAAASRR